MAFDTGSSVATYFVPIKHTAICHTNTGAFLCSAKSSNRLLVLLTLLSLLT